jgi:nucleoside-diphosphate-sugar epimerase
MRIVLIGSGYVGSAVGEAFLARGHNVSGSSRSDEAANQLRAIGIEPVSVDIGDPRSLQAALANADAAVYAVQYRGQDAATVEPAALQAIVDTLAPRQKTLLFTSGAWIYGSTGDRVADEHAPIDPPAVIAHRPQLERIALDGASRGLRPIVLRATDVYGDGGGIPAMFVESARTEGAARMVGDGRNRWPMVHREDLASLYALAFERAQPSSIYNASDETAFTVREMAEAASRGAGKNGAVTAWPVADARKALGPFTDALMLDSHVTSRKAREELGWTTRSSTILDDLEFGSYAGRTSNMR